MTFLEVVLRSRTSGAEIRIEVEYQYPQWSAWPSRADRANTFPVATGPTFDDLLQRLLELPL